jgi:hypothetical protein
MPYYPGVAPICPILCWGRAAAHPRALLGYGDGYRRAGTAIERAKPLVGKMPRLGTSRGIATRRKKSTVGAVHFFAIASLSARFIDKGGWKP